MGLNAHTMKYLLLAMLLICVNLVHAQFETSNLNGAQNLEPTRFGIVTSSSPSNFARINSYGAVFNDGNGEITPDTKGTPYFDENYQIGSIIKDSLVFAENIALRYNVYNDVFIGKVNLVTIEEESKTVIKSQEFKIKMGDQLFIALPNDENPNVLQYYQILVIGQKGTLYKKNMKKYKPRVMATTSLTRDVPPSFNDSNQYFFADFKGHFQEVPSSKKKVIDLMKDKKKEVTECIDKNKLNVKDEKDLIRLIRFYNSI
jgi:hypothetical protein